MSSKENYHLAKFIGIPTKLRQAIGALVIARESTIAVFGGVEVRDWFHAQVYALTLRRLTGQPLRHALPLVEHDRSQHESDAGFYVLPRPSQISFV